MHPVVALGARAGWQLDIRSTVIGAALAWIVAAFLYSQRRALGNAVTRAWAPILERRRRAHASQEVKYLRALQERLRPLLLVPPVDLGSVFMTPSLRTPAPLPSSVADIASASQTIEISYAALLAGHPRLFLSGPQGSGRTTAMMMMAEQALHDRESLAKPVIDRLPIWIDLARAVAPASKKAPSAADGIVAMASAFLPSVLPQWLLQRLRRDRCVVLMDNWELLAPDRRTQAADWIAQAAAGFDDVYWIVAGAPEGYADLATAGFVPVEIVPEKGNQWQPDLYTAWQASLGRGTDLPDEESLAVFAKAAKAGAPPWELTMRMLVHLETLELPARPVEVADRYIAHRIESVNVGKSPRQIVDGAQQVALETLMAIAARERLSEQPGLTNRDMRELSETQLKEQPERSRKLDDAVRKLLTESGLLRHEGHMWHIAHPILSDYFVACHLVRQEAGSSVIESHLDDPAWHTLTEFYAGLADIMPLAEGLFSQIATDGDNTRLRRIARWSTVTDPQAPYHKALIKMLARSFPLESLSSELREDVGRAIAVSAGDGARAYFVQTLRNASPAIRGAALRGLGWCKTGTDLVVLESALRDAKSPVVVRESAAWALLDQGTDEGLSAVARALPEADEALMLTIAEVLAADPRGEEALKQASLHSDLFVRRAAAFGLGRLDADWARERLLEIAREDVEWVVRSAAESALQEGEDNGQKRVSVAAPPQPDELDWLIGWAARQGEGLGVGEAAMGMLSRAAQEGNADAKVLSALTLAQIGRESEVPVLEQLTASLDPLVAQTAAWATRQIRRRHQVLRAA